MWTNFCGRTQRTFLRVVMFVEWKLADNRVSLAGGSVRGKEVDITLGLVMPDCVHQFDRNSSVCIATWLGLDEWGAEVRSQRGERSLYLPQNIHTGSGNHPAFCSMGTGIQPRLDGGYNFQLELRLRMDGAIPPLFLCFCGVVLN